MKQFFSFLSTSAATPTQNLPCLQNNMPCPSCCALVHYFSAPSFFFYCLGTASKNVLDVQGMGVNAVRARNHLPDSDVRMQNRRNRNGLQQAKSQIGCINKSDSEEIVNKNNVDAWRNAAQDWPTGSNRNKPSFATIAPFGIIIIIVVSLITNPQN